MAVQRRSLGYQGEHHGVTVVELLVVIAIIVTLMIGLGRGFGQMQKNYRLSNSAERVLSTLHLARSLAIGNNAVYHVRIVNWTDAVDENGNTVDPYSQQLIKVYCFPDLYVALNLVEDDKLGSTTITDFDTLDARITVGMMNGTLNQIVPRPAVLSKVVGDDVVVTSPVPPNLPQLILPGPNWVLDTYYTVAPEDKLVACNAASVRMEPRTYLGIQNAVPGETTPSKDVLSFNPDGTANIPHGQTMYFYVTDVAATGQTGTATMDYRDSNVLARNSARHDIFNPGKSSGLRMIRVSSSGSIKLLDPSANGQKDRLP